MFRSIHLPCGAQAIWDQDSDMGYRCMTCFAVPNSLGQPESCKEESQKWKTLESLGGLGWDYEIGRQKTAIPKKGEKF